VIVDSSALVAIVREEPGYELLAAKLGASGAPVGIGTPTIVETGVVLNMRLRLDARSIVRALIWQFDLVEVPFTEAHWDVALEAHARFGRSRHPAALNFGDCMTYAVAKVANQPLLFVGDDFAKTDIEAA
jgi:ribonuclease VapC